MNKLEKLIAKLCPNGVEYKPLGEVVDIDKGTQLNRNALSEVGAYPVINGGINPSGFWDEYNFEKDLITVSQGGASAGYVNWIATRFWAGAHCFVLTNPKSEVLYRYVYFVVKAAERDLMQSQIGAGIPSVSTAKLSSIPVPLPPLAVQEEIVRMLDEMTGLIGELEQELAARKQQYEWWRDKLLGDDMPESDFCEHCKIIRGDYITKKDATPGKIPVILGGQDPAYYIDHANHMGKAIVISRSGASAGFVSYWDEPIFATDGFIIETDRELDIMYLYFWLKKSQPRLNGLKKGGGVPHITGENLKSLKIPLPPLAEQKKIVARLESFDKLCNSMTEGLPGEIALRKQQYEFYRDQLLTFKKAG